MDEKVRKSLQDLEKINTAQLKALWHKYFDYKPAQYQRDYMIRRIAYHIQAKAYGGLPKTIRNKLERLAGGQLQMQDKYLPKPGTRLVRDYNGKRICVLVLENGFEYEGRVYATLSAISREIMGCNISGPKFFGLRRGGNG
jgi:hypothetical protein